MPDNSVSAVNAEQLWMADLRLAKREARRGNPWAFIALQWPHLICSREERQFFTPVTSADGEKLYLRLDDFQIDMIQWAFADDHCEEYVKGAVKRGKGFAAGIIVNVWFDIWPDEESAAASTGCKIILTGPSSQHVVNNLFTEVVVLRRLMKKPLPAEILTEAIRADKNHYIIIANPDSGEGFSGQHSGATLFVFDEATSTTDQQHYLATTQAKLILALSNPRVLSGWFRSGWKGVEHEDANQSALTPLGMRRLVTALGSSAINVRHKRLEKPIAPHDGFQVGDRVFKAGQRIPQTLYKQIALLVPAQMDYARYHGLMSSTDENVRRILGEGQFPKEDSAMQVILASWLEHHKVNYPPDIVVMAFGLDVAASADADSTILAAGGPKGVAGLHSFQHSNTMATVGWVIETVKKKYGIDLTAGATPIAVDYGGGYGHAPGDRLRELGCLVLEAHPSKASRFPLRYYNTRAELYGELANRLNIDGPYGKENPWGLPDDPQLFEELTAQEKAPVSDGIKIQLIPKQKPYPGYTGKTIKGAIGRSPDKSDAVALLWRAVSVTSLGSDFSDRHLVHTLEPDVEDEEELTPEEKWKRDRDDHLKQLVAQMDGDADSHSWR